MTFDLIFDILYTPYKYQKTLKNNNLINRKKQLEQLRKQINSLTHWDNKVIVYQSSGKQLLLIIYFILNSKNFVTVLISSNKYFFVCY